MSMGTVDFSAEVDYSDLNATIARCKDHISRIELDAGIEHAVENRPHGYTDRWSQWGSGIPRTIRVCTHCWRYDGPWVSSDIVGGGW